MERTRINGHDLEYLARRIKDREWVVFLHGSLFPDMFVPLISQPAFSNYSTLQYHRRGYAGSDHDISTPPSMGEQASDCLKLMEILDINHAHLVGHSYAGLIALQAAVDAPSKVHSLSLLEPPLAGYVPSGQEFGISLQSSVKLAQEGKKSESLESFLNVVFEGGGDYRKIIDEQLGSKALDMALSDLDTIFLLEYPALQSWKFGPEDAKRLSIPILSVKGVNSPSFFQQVHSVLVSWFPHLETFEVPNTNHMLHIKSPKIVAEGLTDFFARHPYS